MQSANQSRQRLAALGAPSLRVGNSCSNQPLINRTGSGDATDQFALDENVNFQSGNSGYRRCGLKFASRGTVPLHPYPSRTSLASFQAEIDLAMNRSVARSKKARLHDSPSPP